MSELNNLNNLTSPDFSKITEKPRNPRYKAWSVLVLKIILVILVAAMIGGIVMGFIYYRSITNAYDLSFSAKADLEQAVHQVINRDFKSSAESILSANDKLNQAKVLLDKVVIVRYVPYLGTQLKAVDQVLIAGIRLTDSGQKVVLLIDEITEPLKNESITYATITSEQKRQILEKIVASESLLYQVQADIDAADAAIASIPANKLVKPLRDNIEPIRIYLPKVKVLIDNALPMLHIIPKIAGFEQPKAYLFLLQNNSELRPTGGFIGTYGILKLQDGDIKEFDTDNVYNLDRSTQHVIKEPSPWPIEKYLEQKDWALRDINWAPDFPTTVLKALEMYDKENQVIIDIKNSGKKIIGEKGVEITDVIPYQKNLDGVIAMDSGILGSLLKMTGPIVAGNMVFSEDNYQDQLELMVGKLYQELNIPISERKGIIKQLADQIKVKLMDVPLSQMPEVVDVALGALTQKQVMIYSKDAEIQKLILERGWGGEIKETDGDYVFAVDSNLAALKTDQYVKRAIKHSIFWRNGDLIGRTEITYKNNAEFTWKSTRLRSYTRVYVPLGSELISSSGAMENDKVKDPQLQPGQVEAGEESGKTYFGAFISIEPKETGVLAFEYKLPSRIKDQLNLGSYDLMVQKQPGVLPDLTLDLKFGKNIKSADPGEPENEWFNSSYNYSTVLDGDLEFEVKF
jgi:hypothetical protein